MVMRVNGDDLWMHMNNAQPSDWPFWQDATPIWISAVQQGLRAAVFGYPGADVRLPCFCISVKLWALIMLVAKLCILILAPVEVFNCYCVIFNYVKRITC